MRLADEALARVLQGIREFKVVVSPAAVHCSYCPLRFGGGRRRLVRHGPRLPAGNSLALLMGSQRLPSLHPHALRHGFVTISLDEGASLRDVQDAARHADPRTTRRYDKNRNSLNRRPTHRLLGALEP